MKHSFIRLISSFYILLISALMIVISAYAWMVISDSPAAGGIGFGIAGLEEWDIPSFKEPEFYDYMDDVLLRKEHFEADLSLDDESEDKIFKKDESGAYIIDSAEKFVAIMEYIHDNSELDGDITMVLQTHISLEPHEMKPETVTEIVLNDANEEVEQTTEFPVMWNPELLTPIYVDGYNGTGCVTIKVDPALQESTELNGTAYIKGLVNPLFAGGFAGQSAIVINDVTIYASDIVSNNTQGSGAFIECVDSMQKIELDNCHLLNSSIDKSRNDTNFSRVGGLIGWTSGYNRVNDGPVKTTIKIKNCSVESCMLRGTSVGGIVGHAGANAWTYTTIEDCTVLNNELLSVDPGGWRVGEIVGTANVGEVTIIDAVAENNMRGQLGKLAPTDRPSLYGRIVPGDTGKLMIMDTALGDVYVAGGFISESAGYMIASAQEWQIHGDVKLTEEVLFTGNQISLVPYQNGAASITFESVATGLSYPGSPNASAGFNFAEMDDYRTEDMDKVRAEKGSEINFTNIKFINKKTVGKVATNVASRRHPYCMYALAETARYEDCVFEGSLVVYNSADFVGCTFTESVDNRFCLFLDDVYDAEYGEYLISDCTFTAASTAYGCVKISEDASITTGKDGGGKYVLNNSTFTNATAKPAVYVNGYADIMTNGNNQFYDVRKTDESDTSTGGILAKNLAKDGEPYQTYATYNGKICLTIPEYEEDRAKYHSTEHGINGTMNQSASIEDGSTTVTTETTATTGETTTAAETTTEASETTATAETTTEASETTTTAETTTEASETTTAAETTTEASETTTTAETTTEASETTATAETTTEASETTATAETTTEASETTATAETTTEASETTATAETTTETMSEETEAEETSASASAEDQT